MSTERIFGGWDTVRQDTNHLDRELQLLWSHLAAQKVGTPEQELNSGLSQRKSEILQLWQLFHLQRPKVIVEVGVAQGGTFAGWCKLAPADATLIAIDRDLNDCRPRPGEPVHPLIYSGPLAMTRDGGGVYHLRQGGQTVHAINGWSHEPHVLEELRNVLAGRQIDFLFNDASHSKEMFAQDFQLYWPLIAEGGIFATHDIQHSNAPNCDKREEWMRIREHEEYSACFEFLGSRTDDSLGIGVLIK